MPAALLSSCRGPARLCTRSAVPCRARRASFVPFASKGFSAESPEASATNQEAAPPTAAAAQETDVISIEEKIRARRKRVAATAKVKVVNAALEAAKASENSPQSQADATFVSVLALFFVLIILEGLIVAGSGFMSDEVDLFVQNVVYPAFTPTVGLFIACSATYGLFKTGKLPGQKQL